MGYATRAACLVMYYVHTSYVMLLLLRLVSVVFLCAPRNWITRPPKKTKNEKTHVHKAITCRFWLKSSATELPFHLGSRAVRESDGSFVGIHLPQQSIGQRRVAEGGHDCSFSQPFGRGWLHNANHQSDT